MNRRNFFKLAFGMIAAAIVAPKVLIAAAEEAPKQGFVYAPYVPLYKSSLHPANSLSQIKLGAVLSDIKLRLEHILTRHLYSLNDSMTRKDVFDETSLMLEEYQRQRSLTHYAVVCDETNNSPATIDDNQLVVDVHIAPKKELKYITLRAVLSNHGTSFKELQ